MVDERDVLGYIRELVDAEHTLRARLREGELTSEEERAQLTTLEQRLDQCWDLLRQRRARAAAGQDPDDAQVRPISEVEGYLG
jgi:Rad3-related DNA helicase